jgi:hypothetical protein
LNVSPLADVLSAPAALSVLAAEPEAELSDALDPHPARHDTANAAVNATLNTFFISFSSHKSRMLYFIEKYAYNY